VGAVLWAAAAVCSAASFGRSGAINVIRPCEYLGWTNAYRLTNGVLELVILPGIGRIVHLGFAGQTNLLRFDLQGGLTDFPDKSNTNTWLNFGGDWLWPVAQSRWKEFAASDWPPPAPLAERPWTERVWRGDDGSSFCLLTRIFEAPLNIKVRRLIKLDSVEPRVTVHQRAIRVENSPVPISLWSIMQIAAPHRIFLPVGPNSAFANGLKPMIFAPPSPRHVSVFNGIAVYDCKVAGEHKLGSDSPRRWIAAQVDNVLICVRMETSEGVFPDEGCAVEMYANSGMGYAEIETLSPERVLQPRDALQNMLLVECRPLSRKLPAAEALSVLKRILGEH